jgi:hypothetical protein
MLTIIILSIVGAILSAVIGTIWYSNATPMGRIHMEYLGFNKLSEEEQKAKIKEAIPTMPKIYGLQFLLSLLTSFAVVFIMIMSLRNGVIPKYAYGFVVLNWLCFMVPIIGSGILWGNCDRKIAMKKFVSDILSNLVTVLVIAFLASFFA